MMKLLVTCALAVAIAAPALGQGTDFQSLLSGKDTPTTLKVKDLTADWRRVAIAGPEGAQSGAGDSMKQLMQAAALSGKGGGDSMGALMGMSMLGGMFGGGSEAPVYYTKGQTVTVAGETFLVAYRYERPQLDIAKLVAESEKSGKEPDFARMAAESKMTPESPLTLALVNVKSIGTLSGVRPFDLQKELADASNSGGLLDILGMRSMAPVPPDAATVETRPAPPPPPVQPRKPTTGGRPRSRK